MLVHGSNAFASGRPKSVEPRGRQLEQAEQGRCTLGHEALGSGRRVGLALGRRGRAGLGRIGHGVEDEVAIAAARSLGDRAHERIVGAVEAAGEDRRQYVHSGVTVPRMSATGTGPKVRESKLVAKCDATNTSPSGTGPQRSS